jgi:steroid 5-alpha reductase family enzyme
MNTMSPEMLLVSIAGFAAVLMTLLWIWQIIKKDAAIVDVGWSVGLIGAALLIARFGSGNPARRYVFASLSIIWAGRLGAWLYLTRIHGRHTEDGRYARMRAAMGSWAQAGFFAFFHAQTLFVVIFSVPFLGPAMNTHPFPTVWDITAILIWLGAMTGEWTADLQLHRFRSNPSNNGKTCRDGLWNRSRHPNYFFEWLHWFVYIAAAIHSPYFVAALFGPVIMFLFLFFVTGIPHTEKQAASHRSDYTSYMSEVPMFFPRLITRRNS